MCQFCGCEADPPNEGVLIRQGVLVAHRNCVNKSDLRRVIDRMRDREEKLSKQPMDNDNNNGRIFEIRWWIKEFSKLVGDK